jgi:hypothetical protein
MPSLLPAHAAVARRCLVAIVCMMVTRQSSVALAQLGPAPRLDPGVLAVPQVSLPARIAVREQHLHADLRALAAQSKYSGWLGGAVITMGCAAIAVGVAYPRDAGALLFPLGALALSRGVLGLTLMAGRERQAAQYASQPMYTPDQVRARIAFGEAVLAYQARRARIGRIVDGSISLLVTASYVPLVWWLQRRDNPDYRFNDDGFGYAVLALSVVNAGATLFSLLTESGVEQRYSTYKRLVESQEREQPGELRDWRAALSIRPLATRTALGMQTAYRF